MILERERLSYATSLDIHTVSDIYAPFDSYTVTPRRVWSQLVNRYPCDHDSLAAIEC